MLENQIDVKKKLREMIDAQDLDNANRDFLIQYTVFDLGIEKGQCYMNCLLSGCQDEGIYDVDVKYGEDTQISFDSWKGNYESFEHTDCIDCRGWSNQELIYACDLYEDFKPHNYIGHCWTRGGYTGWNWFDLTDEGMSSPIQSN